MAKRKRGGAAKKEPRLTASRFVSEKYGEKGLRALKAMGTEFSRGLQAEILFVRKRNDLLDRKAKAEKALADMVQKIDDLGEYNGGAGSCLPKLEAVIAALPDIEPKKKAEAPAEEAEVTAEVA